MKSLKVLSALFLSSALLTTACTPVDKEVGTPDVMAKIKFPKGNKKSADGKSYNKNQSGFKVGAFAASSVMLEKQIEVVELLQVVLGNADIAKTLYQIEERKTDDKGATTFKLTASKDGVNYPNKAGNFIATAEKDLKVTIAADESEIVIEGKNVLKADEDKTDKNKKFLNTFENSYKLTVAVNLSDASKYDVKLESAGTFNARAETGFAKGPFSFESSLVIDRASLKEAAVQVSQLNSTLTVAENKTKISAAGFTVKVEGRCNELVGSANIDMGKNKPTITFSSSSIVIPGKWDQKIAECGHRPTVDIARLLVW
ncbi:hypothetical protein [Bdellovibrio sp. HCB209]|uniref:hypothetical protein n=1 Tax=Bdellovibrio sp. HCB209 TaxID=3394354 RepID=UPI0039B45E94